MDLVQSSVEAPEFDKKHLKKAGRQIYRNIVNKTIKIIVRKAWMIKITVLCLILKMTQSLRWMCSNITDYFSTRKITTPWRRNTHTHSPIQNKDALAKARTPFVLKPTYILTPTTTTIYYKLYSPKLYTTNFRDVQNWSHP